MKIGIISGHRLPGLIQRPEIIMVETPYGEIDVQVSKLGEDELFFIGRHGMHGNLPPHMVNYRGNIQALAVSHVDGILSVGTVGSMKPRIKSEEFVIPYDFIDVTTSRRKTFFDDKRVHVDMTAPFCPDLREALLQSCHSVKGVKVHEKGVYLVTEGPRLETAAEISFYSSVADIVGMTLSPEVSLAREKGICYASLCLVSNMATGLQQRLTSEELAQIYKKKEPTISTILQQTIRSYDEKRSCHCSDFVSRAVL